MENKRRYGGSQTKKKEGTDAGTISTLAYECMQVMGIPTGSLAPNAIKSHENREPTATEIRSAQRRRKKNDTSQHEPEAVAAAVEHKDTSQQCTVATGSATPETEATVAFSYLRENYGTAACWHCGIAVLQRRLQSVFRSVHATRYCIFVLGILRPKFR